MNKKLKLEELNRKTADEFKKAEKVPVHVVLDDIRSAQNVGSIFRTSDAFLLEKIHICGITATPPHKDIKKTALGASETVSWQHWENATDCVQSLKNDGGLIISVEQTEESEEIQNIDTKPTKENPVVIVFGNEVNGVKEKVIDLSDKCVEIPQFGTKHSLNISVCAGIVLWKITMSTSRFQ